MNGLVPLEEVYAKRLDVARPGRAALAWLAQRYADETVSGAAETIATLKRHGKAVYVITGGFYPEGVEKEPDQLPENDRTQCYASRRVNAGRLPSAQPYKNRATRSRLRVGAKVWPPPESCCRGLALNKQNVGPSLLERRPIKFRSCESIRAVH
jgi:hypothetical protein